ncbi:twin-arginine translocase subunit TatC [Halobacterium yunchengense]|uniref:twin-arginine translocase subunit TatC n=1 Tax=Halobacterium yunchengense TaxID=3108497 RepID=UPI003009C9A9
MADESDGGRERPEWSDLASAVRRVDADDDGAAAATPDDEPHDEPAVGDEPEDGPTPAVRRVSGAEPAEADEGFDRPEPAESDGEHPDSPERVDWDALESAVRRVETASGAGGWDDDDLAVGGDLVGEQATDPQLLADEDHQADEPAGDGESVEADAPSSHDPDDALDPRENSVVDAEETPEPPDDGLGMSAPESDVEQPLAVHVEEMVKRLAVVIAVAGLVSAAVFPVTEALITTIWNYVLPGAEAVDPRVYHPLELIITQLKVASLAGLVVALPVFVYQSYAFMRPGLYRNERRYYLAAVPTSLVLAVLGVLFAYLLVLPYTMDYFQGYTQDTADVAFALGTTFNLILMVMGYLAIVFQIPLFIMLAIMLGVTTRAWMEDRRLLFWAAFAGISFTFGAIDPTGVVPIIVALTMIALFEGTLALLRWTGN